MNSRPLAALLGAVALVGCSSQTNGSPSTKTSSSAPPTATVVAVSTSAPSTSGTSVATATDPVKAGQQDISRGDFTAADRNFRRAIAGHRNVAAAYAGLGNSAMQQHQYRPAYRYFQDAVKRAPKVSGYLYGAASSALYAQDYKGAVRYATALIVMEPKNPAAYHVRMLAYGRLVMLKAHLKDAQTVVKLMPNDAEARDDLGIALANNRKYYQALAQFTGAIQLQPKNYRYYSNRALVEGVIKQRKQAIADVEKAISLTTDPGLKKVLSDELIALQKQS